MQLSPNTDSRASSAGFVPHVSRNFNVRRSFPTNLSIRRPRTGLLTVRCARVNPNDVLTGDQLQEWSKVATLLQSLDPTLAQPEADKLVGRAFGWGTQKFWRGDVKQEPPSLDSAEQSLQFLREQVDLDEKGMAAIIKSFPEVLRLTVARMQENISYIQRTYPNIKGQLLINTVKGTPAVLGYDYDCEGDCKSECARCWVQF